MAQKLKQITTKLDKEINLFEPGTKHVSLDIGSRQVKAVVLKETPVGTRLLGVGIAEIPAAAKDDPSEAAISTAIRNALGQLRVRSKKFATIINCPSLTNKDINLPAMPDEELRESVKWEMGQNIDFPIDDACLDYILTGETIRAGAKNYLIEVVAAKKAEVLAHMQIFERNKLAIENINIPSFCLWNVFQKSNVWKEDDTIAIIDVGAKTSRINIFANNVLRFSREILFGGDTITEDLSKELNLPLAEAEALKIKIGLNDKSAHYEHLAASLRKFVAQIDRSFGYYKAQFHVELISRVVVYGGTAKLINIDKFLSEELGIFSEVGNPFNGLLFDQKAFPNLEEFSPLFAQAIGAAMESGDAKRINLLPAELKKDQTLELKKTAIRLVPVLIIIGMFLIYFNLIKTEKHLKAQKTSKEKIISSWKSQQELQRKLDFLVSLESTQKSWQKIIRGLSSAIPENTWLNSIIINEPKKIMVIRGAGENNRLVIDFVRNLESLPYNKNVKLESVEEKKEGQSPFTYFKVTIVKE